MALTLSGDINLNPGLVNRYQIKNNNFDVFNYKGLHFIQLNISSLLNKINELHYIVKSSDDISKTKKIRPFMFLKAE